MGNEPSAGVNGIRKVACAAGRREADRINEKVGEAELWGTTYMMFLSGPTGFWQGAWGCSRGGVEAIVGCSAG